LKNSFILVLYVDRLLKAIYLDFQKQTNDQISTFDMMFLGNTYTTQGGNNN
jgi:hypothetical protein